MRAAKGEWENLEKLLILAVLHHTQSLNILYKFLEVQVPDVKSSAGTEAPSEENKFLIETLEFIGKVCDDLVKWLLDRGDG